MNGGLHNTEMAYKFDTSDADLACSRGADDEEISLNRPMSIQSEEVESVIDSARLPPVGNRDLPIWKVMPDITDGLIAWNRLILSSPTGSGKTTQIPQALEAAGFADDARKIYVIENRVTVAVETADRIAKEMGVRLGDKVGVITGPHKQYSDNSDVLVVTSGVFRQILRDDPTLSGVSVVLLDEFDERDLLTDLSASIIEQAQEAGSEVKFVLMSATLNTEQYSGHFGGAPIVEATGRMFPVEKKWPAKSVPVRSRPMVAAQIALDIHEQDGSGTILIIAPGKPEVEEISRRLNAGNSSDFVVLPFHGELTMGERAPAFQASDKQKIIVATPIVERGITFEGKVHVVDLCLARMMMYDSATDSSQLRTVACAQDAMLQRLGRAGRTESGTYSPLISEADFSNSPRSTLPELLRSSLVDVVLQIKAMGYSREDKPLRIIDNPDKESWKAGKRQLAMLGALDERDPAKLSRFGERMADLGTGYRDAAMILVSEEFGCTLEAITLAAIRMSRKLFYTPQTEIDAANRAHQKFEKYKTCDGMNLLGVVEVARQNGFSGNWCRENYVSYQALRDFKQNEQQLLSRARRCGVRVNKTRCADPEALSKVIARVFPDRLYVTNGGGMYQSPFIDDCRRLGRESALRLADRSVKSLIVANNMVSVPSGLALITEATAIRREWLPESYQMLLAQNLANKSNNL